MSVKRTEYTKKATTLDEQIRILSERNVVIKDEDKAKECLSDIGYYRLGFYVYPFEKTYPKLGKQRNHEVWENTTIEEIIAFYYYNYDLRNILNKYLSRIEVAVRTAIIYNLSNKYKDDPYWFINPYIVSEDFIEKTERNEDGKIIKHTGFKLIYSKDIRSKEPIKRHHNKYKGEYAPAWKTLEYATFGNIGHLYSNLKSSKDQCLIANQFGESKPNCFSNYLSVITEVRNACAHGNIIAGIKLNNNVKSGSKACPHIHENDQNSLKGALAVIGYMMKQISVHRYNDMINNLTEITSRLYAKASTPSLHDFVKKETGIVLPSDI